MDALVDAFQYEATPYFQYYPFMANAPGLELDGNPILYTGSYGMVYAILFKEYPDAEAHSRAIYEVSKVEPGLISRGPHKMADAETHDDYVGLATLSMLGEGSVAEELHQYGKAHGWRYWREGYTWRQKFSGWFWRLPGVVQHLKLCSKTGKWNFLDPYLWGLGVYFNGTGEVNESGIILKRHMIFAYERKGARHWFCDWAVRKWKEALNNKRPGGMGDIFAKYYRPSHLFVKWMMGRL